MFVKICGLSSEEQVQAAVDAGADAVGFVFADSVRRIDPADAAAISNTVPVSYTHLTLPTRSCQCRSRWSPDH